MRFKGRVTHPLLPGLALAAAAVATLSVSSIVRGAPVAAWLMLGLAAGYSISGSA